MGEKLTGKWFHGVEGSQEEWDYKEFVGSRIEEYTGTLEPNYDAPNSINPRRIGLYALSTKSLEKVYHALIGTWAIDDWNMEMGRK